MTWLTVDRGSVPLIVSVPHAGTEIPPPYDRGLVSPGRARRDTDWHVDRLYAFARDLDATFIRTSISRTVIDVNRDPSGASLYAGFTTALCPLTTCDGDPLYEAGSEPDANAIEDRRRFYHEPYHEALADEASRLLKHHRRVVLFDAHSIRSRAPRLFDGALQTFSLGTNDGRSCDPALARAAFAACEDARFTRVLDGRFKGGWITRHHGAPAKGLHAIQLELVQASYIDEDYGETAPPWTPERAAGVLPMLRRVVEAALGFAL